MDVVPCVVYAAARGSDGVARRDVVTWCTQLRRVQQGGGHICIVIVVSNNRVGLLRQFFVDCCFVITT